MDNEDHWYIAERKLLSRLLLGTARFPSLEVMRSSIIKSRSEVITVSLRRENSRQVKSNNFWDYVRDLDLNILPNTAGCFSVGEAIETAEMARDLFQTNWIKLEIIGNIDTLCPNVFGLVEASRDLVKRGFKVFPYTTDDLIVCRRLVDHGCSALMPWGSYIGSGRGILNPQGIRILRNSFPQIPIIIDAGIGRPSHAAIAMELGCDAVLLNTAVATSGDPERMAHAFATVIQASRQGYLAGLMDERFQAMPSTSMENRPFL